MKKPNTEIKESWEASKFPEKTSTQNKMNPPQVLTCQEYQTHANTHASLSCFVRTIVDIMYYQAPYPKRKHHI